MYSNRVNRLIEIAYRSEYEEAKVNTEKRGEGIIMFNKNRGIEYSKKGVEIEIERKIIPISEIKKKLKKCNNSIRMLDTNRVNNREYIYL